MISKECMKEILTYISNNTKTKVSRMNYHDIDLGSVNITTLLNNMSKDGKYSMEDIADNFIQCYYSGYVNAKLDYKGRSTIQSATSDILGITLKGIEFIQSN